MLWYKSYMTVYITMSWRSDINLFESLYRLMYTSWIIHWQILLYSPCYYYSTPILLITFFDDGSCYWCDIKCTDVIE